MHIIVISDVDAVFSELPAKYIIEYMDISAKFITENKYFAL